MGWPIRCGLFIVFNLLLAWSGSLLPLADALYAKQNFFIGIYSQATHESYYFYIVFVLCSSAALLLVIAVEILCWLYNLNDRL